MFCFNLLNTNANTTSTHTNNANNNTNKAIGGYVEETEGGVNPELERSHSMLAQYLPVGFTFLGFRWLLMFLLFFYREKENEEGSSRKIIGTFLS